MGLIVLIIIIILLVGAFPTWPHSQSWGYGPSGILGTILINRSHPVPPWEAFKRSEGLEKEVHRPGIQVAGEDKLYGAFLRKTGWCFSETG